MLNPLLLAAASFLFPAFVSEGMDNKEEEMEMEMPTCVMTTAEDGSVQVAVEGHVSISSALTYGYTANPKTGDCVVWVAQTREEEQMCMLDEEEAGDTAPHDPSQAAPNSVYPVTSDAHATPIDKGEVLPTPSEGCQTTDSRTGKHANDTPASYKYASLTLLTLDPPMAYGIVTDYIAATRAALVWQYDGEYLLWNRSEYDFKSQAPNELGTNWYLQAAHRGDVWLEDANRVVCTDAIGRYWNTDFKASFGERVDAHHYVQVCGRGDGEVGFYFEHTTWGALTHNLLSAEFILEVADSND